MSKHINISLPRPVVSGLRRHVTRRPVLPSPPYDRSPIWSYNSPSLSRKTMREFLLAFSYSDLWFWLKFFIADSSPSWRRETVRSSTGSTGTLWRAFAFRWVRLCLRPLLPRVLAPVRWLNWSVLRFWIRIGLMLLSAQRIREITGLVLHPLCIHSRKRLELLLIVIFGL